MDRFCYFIAQVIVKSKTIIFVFIIHKLFTIANLSNSAVSLLVRYQ